MFCGFVLAVSLIKFLRVCTQFMTTPSTDYKEAVASLPLRSVVLMSLHLGQSPSW